jgi:hypothetical protein
VSIDGFTADDFAMLQELIKDKQRVFLGGNDIGLPAIQDIKEAEHLGGGVVGATTDKDSVTFDGGGGMSRLPSGKGFTILHVTSGEYPYDFEAVQAILDKLQASI